jgi:DnaJ-class molecular chaperone
MTKIIKCKKCDGTGKFVYKSGIEGICYDCNGKGKIAEIERKAFTITIINNEGKRINWIGQNAKNEKEAIRKAEKIAERGCYAEYINTIKAIENGVSYDYKKI